MEAPENKFQTFSLDEMIDKHIGKIGTENRDDFKNELKIDLLGHAIKMARKERNLTQEQISKHYNASTLQKEAT